MKLRNRLTATEILTRFPYINSNKHTFQKPKLSLKRESSKLFCSRNWFHNCYFLHFLLKRRALIPSRFGKTLKMSFNKIYPNQFQSTQHCEIIYENNKWWNENRLKINNQDFKEDIYNYFEVGKRRLFPSSG